MIMSQVREKYSHLDKRMPSSAHILGDVDNNNEEEEEEQEEDNEENDNDDMIQVREKYSHLDKRMPSSAHLLDVVRGLVSCATADDMVEAFRVVCANFEVLRVKNGFAELQVE